MTSETDNVIYLDLDTRLPIPPNRVLEGAIGQLKEVVLIGVTKNGEEYLAASDSDPKLMSWLIERAKYKIMKISDDN